ncbi:hypothetical protein A2U01_0102431, partial [Trifolium medium]|nr:hypothetical protein [Trifolium medium]
MRGCTYPCMKRMSTEVIPRKGLLGKGFAGEKPLKEASKR